MFHIDTIITVIFLTTLPIGFELSNCMNPHYDGEHENLGILWQWEKEDFQVAERRIWKEPKRYTLKYHDIEDNYFERMFRKKYWKKKHSEELKKINENWF